MQRVYIYILQLSNGMFYTGITKDIKSRLMQHAAGQSYSTKYYLPFNLVYLNVRNSYEEARRLEVSIKNTGALKYLRQKYFCFTLDYIYIDKCFMNPVFVNNNRWKQLNVSLSTNVNLN